LYGRSGGIDATVTTMPPSAVHRALGGAFDGLPAAVRAVHDHPGRLTASGRADAALGPGLLPRVIAALVGMPRNGGDQPVTVTFETDDSGVDHWRRDFAGRRYRSRLFAGRGRLRGLLVERQGILTTGFALEAAPEALHFRVVRFGVLGLPLPAWLMPRCYAVETGAGGAFSFDITIDLPLIGRLIRYRGTLIP
jgi:hypothetical protein